MRLSLFWKLSLTYLLLLLFVLLAVDLYAARVLRRDYLRAAYEQLSSLARLAEERLPASGDAEALRAWASWMARSGARATVVAEDGTVLADSDEDPRRMENHGGRPEVREAWASGEGRATRYSTTVNRELVYLAVRHDRAAGGLVVVRLALPLADVDQALAAIRWRLAGASLVVLLIAGSVSLVVSRRFARRVNQLKELAQRVAEGDFRPIPQERRGDELIELSRALNETASRLDQTIRTLTDERNRTEAILVSMVEGVAVISADRRIRFCNHAFCQAVDAAGEDCVNRSLIEVIRPPELVAAIHQALAGQEVVSVEVAIGTTQPRSFAATAAPVRTDSTTAAVLVLHDITELRRLERVRRDFVANVSHEFKTPLTAIQGFAETLLGGALEDAQNRRRFLEIIRDHAARLGRLTDDLLRLSQIEAGKLDLELLPVPPQEIIEPCLETTRLQAERKGITLEATDTAGLPSVRGDVLSLQEVLQNLLDNAVQYTPSGGRISVKAYQDGSHVVFVVADTGIGIPQADQQRIFERFYRVDAARSREVGGTGLGLSIARHLVEAHGGRIWMASQVGRGSQFFFSVPVVG